MCCVLIVVCVFGLFLVLVFLRCAFAVWLCVVVCSFVSCLVDVVECVVYCCVFVCFI